MSAGKKRPLDISGRRGLTWTRAENMQLMRLGRVAAECYIGECAQEWERVAKILGRSPNACRTRYSKIRNGHIDARGKNPDELRV